MQEIIFLLIIGLAAGIMSGLVGIGGGVIIVPSLMLLLGFSQKSAQGTTLLMFIIPFSILGVWNYYQSGNINVRAALIMGCTFLIGSYLGSRWAVNADTKTIKYILVFFLLLVCAKLVFWDK
ncbi:MAG: sulfite exporter TauE/SafE family protein [Bacteroidia bacterium]|nr:sulfite exporter TauE/SafE family protein [Bacteroidia bacterium]